MEVVRQKLCEIMGDFIGEPKMTNLKELTNINRLAIALWKVDKDLFPLNENSGQKQGSKIISMEEYKHKNKTCWQRILSILSQVNFEGFTTAFKDFERDYLERVILEDEESLEYFCFLFLDFFSKAYPMNFLKYQKRYQDLVGLVKSLSVEPTPNKRNSLSRKIGSLQSSQGNHTGTFHETPSKEIPILKAGKEYNITDKSIQDLLNIISSLQGEVQILREDLIFKEKQSNELQQKLDICREEKRALQEELENKDYSIFRMSYKIESLEMALNESPQSDHRGSLDCANKKVEELFEEIDKLQKKNAYLQRRFDDVKLLQQVAAEGTALNLDQLQNEEKSKSVIKTLTLENKLLQGKLKDAEKNVGKLSDKILQMKDQSIRAVEQASELSAQLTQKEIVIRGLLNDKHSLARDNEKLRDEILQKTFDFKKMESEFIILADSSKKKNSEIQRSGEQSNSAEDNQLELVKVCKEVNDMLKKEIECLYSLLHDNFVSELTGVSLADMIKRRLNEDHRARMFEAN